MILLDAHNLRLYVKDRLLLDIVRLQIKENDRIGLVGRNGSGKTTLLEILGKRKIPDSGLVKTNGICELLPQIKNTDSTKSGGEITQEYINKAIANHPDILFADEPTTNLDTSHIEWLEKKLKRWQGAFVLVSHDRVFLDSLCTTIWEINEGHVKEYIGNYSEYLAQKELERRQQTLAYEKYEKKKSQLEEALRLKERKAERATKEPKRISPSEARVKGAKPYFAKKQKKLHQGAKAIETRLGKLEKVEKVRDIPPIEISLPNEESFKGRIILRVNDLPGAVGERVLWKEASFYIRGGEKLAIIGPNGSGKTTLLKKLINQEQGITLSLSVKIGYFSQNIDIINVNKTILENVSSTSKQKETLIRTALARLHFFRDEVYKQVKVLSGGERVKVALAKLFVSDINTLILDEPTNFLDIESLEALEGLLQEYPGTVIFVSHDRRFIENVGTQILEIKDEVIHHFDGPYEDYIYNTFNAKREDREDLKLILDTKITEVLSRLGTEPSHELEKEYQKLLDEKRRLEEKFQ